MPAIQSYHVGLRDMKAAEWLGVDSYGDAVDVGAANTLNVTLEVQTNQLQGDDVIVDQYAKIISVMANASWGSLDLEVKEIMTGASLVSNDDYEDLLIGQNDNVPYFAIAGRVVGSNLGDLHIFLPKCKIAGNFAYNAAQNTYMVPSVDIRGVWEGELNGFGRERKFVLPTALEIPLRTTTGGFS